MPGSLARARGSGGCQEACSRLRAPRKGCVALTLLWTTAYCPSHIICPSNTGLPLSTFLLASLYESPQGMLIVFQTANTPGGHSELGNLDSTLDSPPEEPRGPAKANSPPRLRLPHPCRGRLGRHLHHLSSPQTHPAVPVTRFYDSEFGVAKGSLPKVQTIPNAHFEVLPGALAWPRMQRARAPSEPRDGTCSLRTPGRDVLPPNPIWPLICNCIRALCRLADGGQRRSLLTP